MKKCPVCNDSFADELNFCDIHGVRLSQEGVVQDRNKWWSLVGAGLLIGAVVISAMTIFLPRARVSPSIVSSETQPAPAPPKPPSVENTAKVAAPNAEPEAEPERATNDSSSPELKKKEKALANGNSRGALPNPKAAALGSEPIEKGPTSDVHKGETPSPRSPETPPAGRPPHDSRVADAPGPKPASTPPELRGDRQPQPASSKSNDKNASDKKKADDKDKKKGGGFLKVFKKIFGKD